jgi:hypothetical protein
MSGITDIILWRFNAITKRFVMATGVCAHWHHAFFGNEFIAEEDLVDTTIFGFAVKQFARLGHCYYKCYGWQQFGLEPAKSLHRQYYGPSPWYRHLYGQLDISAVGYRKPGVLLGWLVGIKVTAP